MECELADDSVWPALLQARSRLRQGTSPIALVETGAGWRCAAAAEVVPGEARQVVYFDGAGNGQPERGATLRWRAGDGLEIRPGRQPLDAATLCMLRVYAPVLLGAAAARAAGRVFVVGHVTQTLDGRIACQDRAPQWIGNAADRRHAHRMRALCDAVMVGASTALGDDPQLTVREVSGPQPVRIVLSGSGSVLRAARPLRLFADHGCCVVTRVGGAVRPPAGVRCLELEAVAGGLEPAAVLRALAAGGTHSIYLEGGARTLSSFLAGNALDLLQIHIAPVVLGSGLSSFELPTISSLAMAPSFTMQHTALDGHVLLCCRPVGRP
jgi:5-amino-6-(5-phosphoribosylamino)uracil reductase/diaminohydroxyphosphoribosylaminopyrimidine deaminase/5-amino-6-(5-phosphoribosylamino)uracil reductase